MLTKKLACPSCGAGLKIADTLPAGKRIKCPKCGLGFPVPAEDEQSRGPKTAAPRPLERSSSEVTDELNEEIEERPRRKKKLRRKKKAASNVPLIAGLIVGLVLLVGGGVAVAVNFWPGKKAQAVAENDPPGNGPAAGVRSGTVDAAPADSGSQQFAAGRKVFEANNCVRCHSIGAAGSPSGGFGGPGGGFGGPRGGRNRGPDLASVGRDPSHTVDWLMEQIRNPKSHKADARMPDFESIKDEDLRALAEYLASLK